MSIYRFKQLGLWSKRLFYTILLVFAGHAVAADTTADLLRERVEEVASLEHDVINVVRPDVLYEFYYARDWQLAWTEQNRRAVHKLLEQAEQHGLRSEEYFIGRIDAFASLDELAAENRVRADVTLTAALMKFGYHLKMGKVQPETLDSNWNITRTIKDDVAARIESVIADDDLVAEFYARFTEQPVYRSLRRLLETYRGYAASGGFMQVAAGLTLRLGDNGPRVLALRKRLAQQGWDTAPATGDHFDETLEQAVKAFQKSHSLTQDGMAGKRVLTELNVPIETRIQQIRVSLERLRWVQDVDTSRALVVNIAGFRVYLLSGNDIVFSARAQVGKPYRQSPVFKSTLKYLVLNPTWTVPPGILHKDVLPAIKKDPGYLAKKHMDVLTKSGEMVNPASIDWRKYPGEPFPYMIRQRPGPWNALGTIKFIFPNPHFVFVHDTPSRNLFNREDRTFSSGCIRIENPRQLAELTLADPDHWNRASLQNVLDSGETKTVFLDTEMPVYLLYLTALAFEDGKEFYFFRDVYKRDDRVLQALDREPSIL